MSNNFQKPIIPDIRIRLSRIIVFHEYSLKPIIRIKPNIGLNRIFVFGKFKRINFYYFYPKITANNRSKPNIRFCRLFKILFFYRKNNRFPHTALVFTHSQPVHLLPLSQLTSSFYTHRPRLNSQPLP
jgi:hypothetical protein